MKKETKKETLTVLYVVRKIFTKNNSFCIKYLAIKSDSATRLVTLSVILPLLLNITSNILSQDKQSYLSLYSQYFQWKTLFVAFSEALLNF